MKLKLILLSVLIGSLTACSAGVNKPESTFVDTNTMTQEESIQASSTPAVPSENDVTEKSGSYDVSQSYIELVQSNPIDKDYEKEFDDLNNSSEFSTQGLIQLETKYIEIWDKELNEIYKKLIAKLDDKPKKLLIEAQKGWLQNHIKETEFVVSTFQVENSFNIGSQGLVNIQVIHKNRLKDRTLQLFEYYYMLEGTDGFIYKSK
ncbi:lysozyme inhibitor LprI family protein [Paenibacillus sp. L3-i20]|uniref:lysozyme inhibitor LprI family protein n=1 Tax=Paenibacillus sp. L3-i20 TaxID=2905833 RepID=UPI001EDCC572|nr:lysozyme inhibitor LprI family protein [Paenibacillus sp. L3-i20]GKU79188.1 hypothetical protein L3i20_v235850 [Paenibacillus sp. L3-i20]